MMRIIENKKIMAGWTRVLILAVLLNLSGHLFLHLGDSYSSHQESQFTGSHHEQKNNLIASHQCSICQDAQHLSLETPQPAAPPELEFRIDPDRDEHLFHHTERQLPKSPRAPPQN